MYVDILHHDHIFVSLLGIGYGGCEFADVLFLVAGRGCLRLAVGFHGISTSTYCTYFGIAFRGNMLS